MLRLAPSMSRTRVAAASYVRTFATVSPVNTTSRSHKVVVVGGGTAGLTVSHQLLRSGKFSQDDIAVVDPAQWHHYQPGWTLVGGGLNKKEDFRRPLARLIDPKLKFYNTQLGSVSPETNSVTLGDGENINYEQLVVAPGITLELGSIKGLKNALDNPDSNVSCVYSYDYCDKASRTIESFKKGNAIFTQPAGTVKCAGAPQKIMWLALDRWRKAGLYDPTNPYSSNIHMSFATGLPGMFGVPKYSTKLEELRKERGVEGLFQHDLTAIDGNTATFTRLDTKETVTKPFDILHAVPKMGPYAFIKNSPLADAAGFVDVNQETLRHKKYANVWSLGDASSLPTSKTAAAITMQAPVLIKNLMLSLEGKDPSAAYNGYTSCPLLTSYGKVLLAEFKYGGVPDETFKSVLDQGKPQMPFYYLKKDFFPWVYYHYMVKGKWAGPKGPIGPVRSYKRFLDTI